MSVVLIATVFALTALITGICAIGSGHRWEFATADIWKGRKNAVLYVWVTFSSMFSLAHAAACIQYLLVPRWGYGHDIQAWFVLHALIGLILSSAHGYIYYIMERSGATELYLWGKLRNV